MIVVKTAPKLNLSHIYYSTSVLVDNRLVPILAGSLFYVSVPFNVLLVYDTSKKVVFSPEIRRPRVTPHPIPITGHTPSVHEGVWPVLRVSISAWNLALKLGENIGMGWVLYLTKWVNSVYHKPQHKTQPQHTTTKMSGRRPPSGGLAPLSPWAGEICPQIIAPLFPHKCAQVASRWSCACQRRFHCLDRKWERWAAPRPWWLPFVLKTQQLTNSWCRR